MAGEQEDVSRVRRIQVLDSGLHLQQQLSPRAVHEVARVEMPMFELYLLNSIPTNSQLYE